MKKQTWEDRIAHAHQIFYDETGIEISLAIDRALKKVLADHDRELCEGLEGMKTKRQHGEHYPGSAEICCACEREAGILSAQEFIKKGII